MKAQMRQDTEHKTNTAKSLILNSFRDTWEQTSTERKSKSTHDDMRQVVKNRKHLESTCMSLLNVHFGDSTAKRDFVR